MIKVEKVSDRINVVRCRDCKYFEVMDWWGDLNGFPIPILATSDCPTCTKWGDGCKTDPNGYCFLGEPKVEETDIHGNQNM